jgi:hypothetical protein
LMFSFSNLDNPSTIVITDIIAGRLSNCQFSIFSPLHLPSQPTIFHT